MSVLENKKHEAVALAFLADPQKIGWRAYQKIYPHATQKAASVAFTRLLKNASFASRINETHEQAAQDAVMSAQEVLAELSKLGRSSLQNVIVDGDDTDDVVTALRDMKPEHAAAVSEFTIETYEEGRGDDAKTVKRVKVRMHNKTDALNLLGKHHILFTDKTLHVHEGIADRLAAALTRTDGKRHVEKRPDSGAPRARRASKIARKGKRARA